MKREYLSNSKWLILTLCFITVACGGDSPEPIVSNNGNEQPDDPGSTIDRTIQFQPISSKLESVVPKPPAPYAGNYTSITEVFEDNGSYYMMLNDLVGGWPSQKINVSLLKSDDLESWTWLPNPILTSEDMPFDLTKPHAFATSLIKNADGTYSIYFDVLDNTTNLGIGLATATALDGEWSVENSMVLSPDTDNWDATTIAGAEVIMKDGTYLMYYMGALDDKPNGETALGLAESDDGINWTRRNQPVFTKSLSDFDSHKIGVPKVIEDDGGFTLIYRTDNGDGSWAGDSAYGVAKSTDGITWTRPQNGPVLSENDVTNWETIWACGLIKVENTYHLFLEYDGPPVFDTRINHATYTPN